MHGCRYALPLLPPLINSYVWAALLSTAPKRAHSRRRGVSGIADMAPLQSVRSESPTGKGFTLNLRCVISLYGLQPISNLTE